MIDPGGYGVDILAKFFEQERCVPTIIAQRTHNNLMPVRLRAMPVAQHTVQNIVTVGEGIDLYHHILTQDPLDWKAPGLDFRLYVFDDHTPSAIEFESVRHGPSPGLKNRTAKGGKRSIRE
jgi:hypothetical protein